MRHPKSGKIGISREEGNVTFSRSGLAQYLIDQARKLYPTSIRFHFNAACAGESWLTGDVCLGPNSWYTVQDCVSCACLLCQLVKQCAAML